VHVDPGGTGNGAAQVEFSPACHHQNPALEQRPSSQAVAAATSHHRQVKLVGALADFIR
jgi:hypothetical protein